MPDAPVLLSLRGLRKTFDTQEAVSGIDLDVYAGEFLTLLGPSGCGKSTLLRLIAGLETCTVSWFSGNRTFADFFKIVRSERTHSFKVRFLRHWQSIDPMVQEGREGVCFPPQAHRFDELHRVIPWKVARQQRLLLLLPVTSA